MFFHICICGIRISLGIEFYRINIKILDLSNEEIHRIQGILIYYGAMCLIYIIMMKIKRIYISRCSMEAIDKQANAKRSRLFRRILGWSPLHWYILVVVIVPVINGAFSYNPSLVIEHIFWIVIISLLITLVFITFRKGGSLDCKIYLKRAKDIVITGLRKKMINDAKWLLRMVLISDF